MVVDAQGGGGKVRQRKRKQTFRIFRSYGLPSLAWICGIRHAKPPQPAGVASTRGNGAREQGAGVANVDKLRVRHVAQRKHHKNYFKSDAERFSGVDTTHTDMT